MFKAIIISVLLASTLALSEEDTLRRLAHDSFARQILLTINLQADQPNAESLIYAMLNQLFYDLRNEDSAAAKTNGERQAYCAEQLARIQGAQENALVAKADYERQVPSRQEELRDKRAQHEQKGEEVKRNEQLIINFTNQRAAEHQEYERKRDEMIAMINGLKQAQQLIRQLQTSHPGGALVQLADHHKNLMNTLAATSEYQSIATLLIELCADAKIHSDQDNVQVILDIIDDLVESIYQVQKREMYAEDWAQKFFEQDLIRLQKENVRLLGSQADDQAKMEFAATRLEELSQQIAMQQMLYDNKEIERQDFDVSCKEDATAAEQGRESRQEQIKVILELLELFENHFSDRIRAVLAELFS